MAVESGRLVITSRPFSGRRFWFTCQLIMQSVTCNHQAGKLYLPPDARYFGCRKCYDLSYRSCREAHQAERVFGRLGLDPASAPAGVAVGQGVAVELSIGTARRV